MKTAKLNFLKITQTSLNNKAPDTLKSKEKLLTIREVAQILDLSEADVIGLANSNLLPHFKIGGEFLRFRKDDILKVKEKIQKKYNFSSRRHNFKEKIKDFLYFNDFYIFSTLTILFLLWIIFKDFR